MKIKNLLLFSPLLLLSLTACSKEDKIELVTKSFEFKNLTTEYDVKDTSINTYYINESSTGYINIKEFLAALNGFTNYSKYHFSKIPFQNVYTISFTNSNMRYRMYINYQNNTISINNVNALFNTVETSDTDYSYGIKQSDTEFDVSGGGEYVFDLDDYFDIYYSNGNIYMPFVVANTMFCSTNYYNIYFNGDMYYGTYLDLEDNYDLIKDNSLNSSVITKEMREDNYNNLLFTLNNFYGLKDYLNISSFEEYINQQGIKDLLLSTDPIEYSLGYEKLFFTALDDPHSAYSYNSMYHEKDDIYERSADCYSERRTAIKNSIIELDSLYQAAGNTDSVRFYDDTAIITIEEMKTGTDSQIFDAGGNVLDTAKDYDSYYYMLDAMKQIKENTNINNIMLDISRSGGGNIAAMIRILGFLTDNPIESTQYCDFGEMAITSYYYCDTNLNGNYSDADSYSDYNWGVLTSSYTYSAANTLTSIVKAQNICKVYGEKTGGGMCSILPIVMLDGSTMYISSYLKLAIRGSNEITGIEAGVSPDIEATRTSFYDDSYIDSLFNK